MKDFRFHAVRRTVSQRIADEFGEGMTHSILGHARQRLGRTYIPNRPLKEQRDGSSGGVANWTEYSSRAMPNHRQRS